MGCWSLRIARWWCAPSVQLTQTSTSPGPAPGCGTLCCLPPPSPGATTTTAAADTIPPLPRMPACLHARARVPARRRGAAACGGALPGPPRDCAHHLRLLHAGLRHGAVRAPPPPPPHHGTWRRRCASASSRAHSLACTAAVVCYAHVINSLCMGPPQRLALGGILRARLVGCGEQSTFRRACPC